MLGVRNQSLQFLLGTSEGAIWGGPLLGNLLRCQAESSGGEKSVGKDVVKRFFAGFFGFFHMINYLKIRMYFSLKYFY